MREKKRAVQEANKAIRTKERKKRMKDPWRIPREFLPAWKNWSKLNHRA